MIDLIEGAQVVVQIGDAERVAIVQSVDGEQITVELDDTPAEENDDYSTHVVTADQLEVIG